MSIKFYPDFIIIPYPVLIDKNLQPQDKNIFGIIYWFEHLKDGKCTASNKIFAEILGIQSLSGIQQSIKRLEENGHIKKLFYKDGQRKEIKTTISFKKVTPPTIVGTPPTIVGGINNNKQIRNKTISKDIVLSETTKLVPSEHKQIITYFFDRVKEECGSPPEINGEKDGAAVKRVLKKYKINDVKRMIDFYLDNDKVAVCGYNLATALSKDTINRWLYEERVR